MHRFQPGNENPILNDKLLREAYEAGRQQALNEQMGGGGDMPTFQQGPLNTSATKFPGGGNRMGMGQRGKAALAGGLGLGPPIEGPNGESIYPFGPESDPAGELPDWLRYSREYNYGRNYYISPDGNTMYSPDGMPLFYRVNGYWYPYMA